MAAWWSVRIPLHIHTLLYATECDILAGIVASSGVSEVQAKQAVQRLHELRKAVDGFAQHATTLAGSKSLDPAAVMGEANKMLATLLKYRTEVQGIKGLSESLARSLSSRPPAGGGMSPAATWGPELRAGCKQFSEAVGHAELAMGKLYKAAGEQINLPTRTATEAAGLFDVFLLFVDVLTKMVEHFKQKKK